ncbi:hypothetical protein DR74_3109 [Enterobacter cloacae]|nr:hypothetical protein DR74_3109 [Enterobacter cloacae]
MFPYWPRPTRFRRTCCPCCVNLRYHLTIITRVPHARFALPGGGLFCFCALCALPGGAALARAYKDQRKRRSGQPPPPPGKGLRREIRLLHIIRQQVHHIVQSSRQRYVHLLRQDVSQYCLWQRLRIVNRRKRVRPAVRNARRCGVMGNELLEKSLREKEESADRIVI